MSEVRHIEEKGYRIRYRAYTEAEIKAAWTTLGQGHLQASVDFSKWCVYVTCSEDEAIVLSALFVRQIFAIPTCTHYRNGRLSLYFGDAGSTGVERCHHNTVHMVSKYFRDKNDIPDDLFAVS